LSRSGSAFPDVLLAVSAALGTGIATNAAYDLIKQAVERLVRRTGTPTNPVVPHRPESQLTRAEALTLALGRIAEDWPERRDQIGQLSIRSEQRSSSGQWRFRLANDRHAYTIIVPPGDRALNRLSVDHQALG
jgi:hypothetical protein